ncbi:MAG: DNA topoisomerase [Gordonibacter sp.]|uniref:type IA DNA topoisomerase n=1 Tax=Gordonibacter sp. TaxID=1968902 RepID=UPI002FCA0A03
MIVIYAEKPSLGRKIAEALGAKRKGTGFMSGMGKSGEEIFVTWGFGHMGGLVYPEAYDPRYKSWQARPCPFIPDEYRIAPQPDRGVEAQLAVVADAFKPGNTVICATDDDREGELIFAYVCELIGYEGPYQRVKIDSLTTGGIRRAFGALIDGAARKDIVAAGRARAIADWVVGINLTCASTLHFMRGKSKTMSVGRVQTPTLAMIVERELAIQNFQGKSLFTPTATVTMPDGETYTAKSESGSTEDERAAKTLLERVRGCDLKVDNLETKEKRTNPPLLYSQTTLQMDANKKLGYTAQQTLDCSQELYEQGFITYPRTSSQYLTSDMAPTVHKVLEILGRCERYKRFVAGASLENFPSSTCNDDKVESHFAIVPTGKIPQGASPAAVDLYDLIAKSLIRLYYPAALVEETTATHHAVTTPACPVVQSGQVAVGCTVLAASSEPERFVARGTIIRRKGWWAVDAMPKREKDTLPPIEEDHAYPATFEVRKTETKPPKRYTDETLVSAMKSAGKSLEDEDYKEILSDPRHMGIGTDATRAGIIETLVGRGFIERKKKQIHATPFGIQVIKTLPIDDLKSATLTAQWEQRLKAVESGTDDMEQFVRDIEEQTRHWCESVNQATGVIVTLKEPDPELVGATCPLCGAPLRFTTAGVGCAAFPFTQCAFTIWSKVAQKQLTKNQMATLAVKGKTPVLKGFISKKGEKFDAALVVDTKTGRTTFSFPPREG